MPLVGRFWLDGSSLVPVHCTIWFTALQLHTCYLYTHRTRSAGSTLHWTARGGVFLHGPSPTPVHLTYTPTATAHATRTCRSLFAAYGGSVTLPTPTCPAPRGCLLRTTTLPLPAWPVPFPTRVPTHHAVVTTPTPWRLLVLVWRYTTRTYWFPGFTFCIDSPAGYGWFSPHYRTCHLPGSFATWFCPAALYLCTVTDGVAARSVWFTVTPAYRAAQLVTVAVPAGFAVLR